MPPTLGQRPVVKKKPKRKTYVFLIGFALLLINTFQASAFMVQQGTPGITAKQTIDDQAAVLQKCIDLPELQPFLPKNQDGSYKTVNVMQHSISFPGNINVAHQGKPLLFISKGLATGGTTEAYFLFNQFQVDEHKAWVEFVLYYEQTMSAPKMQVVTLQLEKTGTNWSITQSKIEGRQS